MNNVSSPHSHDSLDAMTHTALVALLGAVVAGWSYRQTRLQVPHGAEAAPSRFGFWLTILLIGAVLLAGGIFGLKLLASGSA